MRRQTISGGNTVAARAHGLSSAANDVARSLRVEGMACPAEAYQVIGSLGRVTETTQEMSSAVAAWLGDAGQEPWLTVREGPFVDEPEAAVAVVVDALARVSTACAVAHAELERAHIAAADIGTLSRPAGRASGWRS